MMVNKEIAGHWVIEIWYLEIMIHRGLGRVIIQVGILVSGREANGEETTWILESFGENHVEACPYKVDPTSFTFPWILLHLLIYWPYPSSRDRDPRCTLSLYPSVGTFSRIQGGVTAMNISRFNGPSVGPYKRLVMIGKSLRDKKKNNPQIIPANRNALPLKLSTHRRITGAEAQF